MNLIAVEEQESAPHRKLCTDCGISRTSEPSRCSYACQFIQPDYERLERETHGRVRRTEGDIEPFFGVIKEMHQAALTPKREGAQWTGITTRLGESLLASGEVSAVLCIGPDANDPWRPVPKLITKAEDMANCRGMRMGYAPLLQHLEPAIADGHKRIAVIGIPCQVYALRALERELDLDHLVIIGTPCSDNTTTENFHEFLSLLDNNPERINYLEFMPDFHVELRFDKGKKRRIPFLQLPIADLRDDFFPLTCRTCVDYVNTLSDITVGYMGGRGDQWLLVRNQKGQNALNAIRSELRLKAPTTSGNRYSAVKGFIENTRRATGGLPLRRMPQWLRPIVGKIMPLTGPKGLEFARTRLEMKAAESILHLRRAAPKRLRTMVPKHVWSLAEPYGLKPSEGER